MPPTSYYTEIGLDPQAPPAALAAQLDRLIAQAPPGQNRADLARARAILGDPGKKSHYDARLRDPAAPPWTPQELHQLALAPAQGQRAAAPSAPASAGQWKQLLGGLPKWALPAVAAALVLVLVIVVAVSCGGSGDSTNRSSGEGVPTTRTESTPSSTTPDRAPRMSDAEWTVESRKPRAALRLKQGFDLPAIFSKLTALELRQFQDKNMGVMGWTDERDAFVAIYDQNGAQVSVQEYKRQWDGLATGMPEGMKGSGGNVGDLGTYQIIGDNGVSIPNGAIPRDGTTAVQNRVVAMTIYQDNFDPQLYWVILADQSKLYKAELVWE